MRGNPFHQSAIWEKLQSSLGVETLRIDGVLVLLKQLPLGKTFIEVQRGEFSEETWGKIKSYGLSRKAIFCRLSSNFEKMPEFLEKREAIKKIKSHRFPEMSLVVELKNSEELLKNMSQSGRRHLRKAQKEGVVIEESRNVDDFFELLQETTKRDGFSGHGRDFYQKLLDSGAFLMVALGCDSKDKSVCEQKNCSTSPKTSAKKILSAGIFAYSGKNAIYLYGVSSSEDRKLQSPTLLQWETMLKASGDGMQYYDFFGVAPKEEKNHPWQGVSQFKRKFGGEEICYAEEIEISFSEFWYTLYKVARKIR